MSSPGWPPGMNGVVIVPCAGQRSDDGPAGGTAGSFGAAVSAIASRRASKRERVAERLPILADVKRLTAIAVLLALAAAGCGKKHATTTVQAIGEQQNAKEVSPDDLRSLSAKVGHPVYWIGEESGHIYECRHRFRIGAEMPSVIDRCECRISLFANARRTDRD